CPAISAGLCAQSAPASSAAVALTLRRECTQIDSLARAARRVLAISPPIVPRPMSPMPRAPAGRSVWFMRPACQKASPAHTARPTPPGQNARARPTLPGQNARARTDSVRTRAMSNAGQPSSGRPRSGLGVLVHPLECLGHGLLPVAVEEPTLVLVQLTSPTAALG